jgi:hypothetical protein
VLYLGLCEFNGFSCALCWSQHVLLLLIIYWWCKGVVVCLLKGSMPTGYPTKPKSRLAPQHNGWEKGPGARENRCLACSIVEGTYQTALPALS